MDAIDAPRLETERSKVNCEMEMEMESLRMAIGDWFHCICTKWLGIFLHVSGDF